MRPSPVLLAALALFAADSAVAANDGDRIGLQFGYSVPTGDFSKSTQAGTEVGLLATFMESDHAGVGVDVAYHVWDPSDDFNAQFAALLGPGWEIKLSAIQTTAHVRYVLPTPGRVRPTVTGGFGIYWLKTTLDPPMGSSLDGDWDLNFGYNAGAGVHFELSPRFDIGVGGRYHIIQASDSNAHLITVGVELMVGERTE